MYTTDSFDEYFVEDYPADYDEAGSPGFGMLLPVLSIIIVAVLMFIITSRISFVNLPSGGGKNLTGAVGSSQTQSVTRPNTQNKGSPLAPFFRPEVLYWEKEIVQWASDYDLDPNLVATVMQIESCGAPNVVSRAGAMGLFQVMPYHFEDGEDSFNPGTNAKRGLSYLKRSLDAHNGDERLGMAGYNGGIAGTQRAESSWAAETKRYAYWGYGIYMDSMAGKSDSPTLEEWLRAGGSSLCARARDALSLQ